MGIYSDIQTRGTGYYFRKGVPEDIRDRLGGKRELVRSLGETQAKAKVLGRDLSLMAERLFLDIRDNRQVDVREALDAISKHGKRSKQISEKPGPNHAGQNTGASTLVDTLASYQAERKLPPKMLLEFTTSVRRFGEVVGDKRIGDITKADARAFKDALLRLPKFPPKKLRNAPIPKIIAATKGDPTLAKIAPPTIGKALGAIRAILGWAEGNGVLDANPFSKVKVSTGERTRQARLPYAVADLKLIFSSPIFTGCLSGRHRGKKGQLVIRDHSYWLPWLGLPGRSIPVVNYRYAQTAAGAYSVLMTNIGASCRPFGSFAST